MSAAQGERKGVVSIVQGDNDKKGRVVVKKYNIFIITLSLALSVLSSCNLFSLTKGSDTVVSIENPVTFPAIDLDNQMLTFGYFKNGFSLQDALTTCTFASVYPVSGDIGLHGGTIYLGTDLIFHNNTVLNTSGIFYGNQHQLDLCTSITGFPLGYDTVFKDVKLFLSADLYLSGTAKFIGNCSIDGRGNRIVFGPHGHIIVGHNTTLKIRDTELDGVIQRSMWCVDNSSKLILDNMRWVLTSNYTFSNGSFSFQNDVNFAGPYVFAYESALTSTIEPDSSWRLNDIITVSMGRKNGFAGREPLFFTDKTSRLTMENSTLGITSSGMSLTRGTVLGDGEVRFDSHCTHVNGALVLGDGTVAGNVKLKLLPEAAFNLIGGQAVYNVVGEENFLSNEVNVQFIHDTPGTIFHILQDINFKNVTLKLAPDNYVAVVGDKKLILDDCPVMFVGTEYNISSTRLNDYYDGLYQNDHLGMRRGNYPKMLYIFKDGNSITGMGNILYPVVLHDSGAHVTLDLEGRFFSDIILNGGTVELDGDLLFGKDAFFSGVGTVQAGAYTIHAFMHDKVITSTLNLTTNNHGVLMLDSDVALTSQLIFSGDWKINGKNSRLDLTRMGSIIVAKNSVVDFSDVKIIGLQAHNIRCADDSAKIIFNNTDLAMAADYHFAAGSFNVKNGLAIAGEYVFEYESALTSTVDTRARLVVCDGSAFAVGRKVVGGREPLYFEDASSKLELDNSSLFVTPGGASFTRGAFVINRDSIFDILSTSTTNGIVIGDNNFISDFSMQMNAAASLTFLSGHLVYKNIDPYFFNTKNDNARILLGKDFYCCLLTNCAMKNIAMEPNALTNIFIDPATFFTFDNVTENLPGTEFKATATVTSLSSFRMGGNGEIIMKTGSLPVSLLVTGAENYMYGLGGVTGPVTIQGADSWLDFGLAGEIGNDIVLDGGLINLSRNVWFGEDCQFKGAGTVQADNCSIAMGYQDLILTGTIRWQGINQIINFSSDVLLTSSLFINGNCTISSNGKYLRLHKTGTIVVEKNSTLTFRDMTLKDLAGTNIVCSDASSRIVFDNTSLRLSSDFSFTVGSILFSHEIDIGGMHTFMYQSGMTSTIAERSYVKVLENTTLALGRTHIGGREPLYFENDTSLIKLDNATLQILPYGANLMRGQMVMERDNTLDIISTNNVDGLMFGDGVDAKNDFHLMLSAVATLFMPRGNFVFNCNDNRFVTSKARTAKIIFSADDPYLHIHLKRSIILENFTGDTSNLWYFGMDPDTTIYYNDYVNYYQRTGTMVSTTGKLYKQWLGYTVLEGGDSITVYDSNLPHCEMVTGAGNTISGIGGIGAPIEFLDASAQLTLAVKGGVDANLTFSLGSVILGAAATFGQNNGFIGMGTVVQGAQKISMGGADYQITSTLYIDGSGGEIQMRSDMQMSSRWTFSGNCVVNGQGNMLDLRKRGQILVERGSVLTLRNISISGLTAENLRCFDAAGCIVFDGVNWIQDGDFQFKNGSFVVNKYLNMFEAHTFSYQSSQQSIINHRAKLELNDDFKFSYAPPVALNNLLIFDDSTAKISMNGATLHSTSTGLQLTRGILELNGYCSFESDAQFQNQGIMFGDGVSADNDLNIDIFQSACLNLKSGAIQYKNVD